MRRLKLNEIDQFKIINPPKKLGSGIFIAARSVLENAGNPGLTLCVWLAAGLISLIGAICFTELGTMIQTEGGTYGKELQLVKAIKNYIFL